MTVDVAGTATSAPARVSSAKIVIAGGFGVGKTTLVGAVSEITPLRTEEVMTAASEAVDDTSLVEGKTTTTVAMDFGRITIDESLILYLFGTPGQDRFWYMWDELCQGAIGAIVLADTRRLADCFASVDYMDNRRMPYVVALNQFDGAPAYDLAEVRTALRVPEHVPVLTCDARDRSVAGRRARRGTVVTGRRPGRPDSRRRATPRCAPTHLPAIDSHNHGDHDPPAQTQPGENR